MNYKLAKQLKDAGFEQHGENDASDYFDRDFEEEYKHSDDKANRKYWVYCPSLEELINACGDEFNKLIKVEKNWTAESMEESWATDKTPSESVAKLYIKLNK